MCLFTFYYGLILPLCTWNRWQQRYVLLLPQHQTVYLPLNFYLSINLNQSILSHYINLVINYMVGCCVIQPAFISHF